MIDAVGKHGVVFLWIPALLLVLLLVFGGKWSDTCVWWLRFLIWGVTPLDNPSNCSVVAVLICCWTMNFALVIFNLPYGIAKQCNLHCALCHVAHCLTAPITKGGRWSVTVLVSLTVGFRSEYLVIVIISISFWPKDWGFQNCFTFGFCGVIATLWLQCWRGYLMLCPVEENQRKCKNW